MRARTQRTGRPPHEMPPPIALDPQGATCGRAGWTLCASRSPFRIAWLSPEAMARRASCESLFDEALMMARRPLAIDPGVGSDCGFEVFVTKQLPDRFEASWLGIEKDLRTQMTELMRGKNDPGSPPCICPDQPGDSGLAFWRAIGIDEQPIGPTADDFGRNTVAVLDQHLRGRARDVESHVRLVLHLGRGDLQARDGVRLRAHKQMNVKR